MERKKVYERALSNLVVSQEALTTLLVWAGTLLGVAFVLAGGAVVLSSVTSSRRRRRQQRTEAEVMLNIHQVGMHEGSWRGGEGLCCAVVFR